MGSICQTQVNIKVTEGETKLLDLFVKGSMHLNINLRLRDLDTHRNINQETRHLCEKILPYHARYKTTQRLRDQQFMLCRCSNVLSFENFPPYFKRLILFIMQFI